jgi:transcriptional regulator with XRE-family HTH domain
MPNGLCDKKIFNRLKEIRSSRGMKQEDLANLSGVSVQTVRNWEAGKGISSANLSRVASALGCTAQEILGEDERRLTIAQSVIIDIYSDIVNKASAVLREALSNPVLAAQKLDDLVAKGKALQQQLHEEHSAKPR